MRCIPQWCIDRCQVIEEEDGLAKTLKRLVLMWMSLKRRSWNFSLLFAHLVYTKWSSSCRIIRGDSSECLSAYLFCMHPFINSLAFIWKMHTKGQISCKELVDKRQFGWWNGKKEVGNLRYLLKSDVVCKERCVGGFLYVWEKSCTISTDLTCVTGWNYKDCCWWREREKEKLKHENSSQCFLSRELW